MAPKAPHKTELARRSALRRRPAIGIAQTMHNPYTAHARYARPAMARPELWRVGLVLLACEAAFNLTPTLIEALGSARLGVAVWGEGRTAFSAVVQLGSFALTAAVLVSLVRRVHGRDLGSLLGDAARLRGDLWRVFWAVAAVIAVQEVLFLWLDWDFVGEVRALPVWLLWLVPGMLALLVQVATEELLFRGYLQQQLAARFHSPWLWMGVPSVLFGMAHLVNGIDAADGVLWAIWATALGLACADLTARTGSLGAAIGLHLANNVFAVFWVAVQGWPMSGLALFLYPWEDPETLALPVAALLSPWGLMQVVLSLVSVLVLWLAARVALRA